MKFFEYFNIVKKRGGSNFCLTYKDKRLATINRYTLIQITKDFACKEIFSNVSLEKLTQPRKTKNTEALQLARVYVSAKRKFFKNKNIQTIDEKSPDFKHFKKAIEIINTHNTNYKIFLNAQIKGLEFIKEKGGIAFPKPSHLSSTGAEDRLLDALAKMDGKLDKNLGQEIKVAHYDKVTPLRENYDYVDRLRKFKRDEATYHEVKWLQAVFYTHKGRYNQDFELFLEEHED